MDKELFGRMYVENMVQQLYRCEECGAVYDNQEIASKCEDHCRKFNACNMEFLEKSIGTVSNNRFRH